MRDRGAQGGFLPSPGIAIKFRRVEPAAATLAFSPSQDATSFPLLSWVYRLSNRQPMKSSAQ
jgi:hypothetical protein